MAHAYAGLLATEAIRWRDEVVPEDADRVRALVAATGMFSAEEIAIAEELVLERLAKGPASGYAFILAERGGRLAGYACHGLIPGSEVSHDLYWIAVHPDFQGGGLGRAIQARAEAAIRGAGGLQVYADTSSSPGYAPTRAFYARMGFTVAAELPDFYRVGDGKTLLCKRLAPASKPAAARWVAALKIAPAPAGAKGVGVFATAPIVRGEVMSRDCTIPLDPREVRAIATTRIDDYYFAHPGDDELGLVVLGLASLCNHADVPTALTITEHDPVLGWVVTLVAARDIAEGEEITRRYACPIWFEPATQEAIQEAAQEAGVQDAAMARREDR